MMVYSVWQSKGTKVEVETLIMETPDEQEARRLYQRLLEQGYKVRLAGPHEPMDTDTDFPLEY